MGWAVNAARIMTMIKAYIILVGKPEGKIPLGRSRSRCEDNIKKDFWGGGGKEVGCVGWIRVAEGRER
jgi:hypothetical protein